jgi:hypothetical protein
MPGLIYMHLSLGILAHEIGLFRPGSWPERLRILRRGDRGAIAQASGEVVLAISVVYFLVPQLVQALTAPHLLRPYLAPLMGKENKQIDLLPRFRSLLQGVGRWDVVLSDDHTMWSVPSANGRVVHSLHTELFVPESEEEAQLRDVKTFFDPGAADHARVDVLRRHNVRWIILNRLFLDKSVFEHLRVGPAVVRQDDFLILMDARLWIERREPAQAGHAMMGRRDDHLSSRSRVGTLQNKGFQRA